MIKKIETDSQTIIYDDQILNEETAKFCFRPEYWQENDKVVGCAKGRGVTWFIDLGILEGALRHYRRGGLFGKLVKDHYVFTGWGNTRSQAEFMLLRQLREKGVNVPTPIAALAQRKGFFYQADILTEKVPNSRDLVDILQNQPLAEDVYYSIGRMIAKMHAANVNHTDLNIHNILIDNNLEPWIIDFDKCYHQQGDGWKKLNLARLQRSFNKEKTKRAIRWKEDEWLHILAGYNG